MIIKKTIQCAATLACLGGSTCHAELLPLWEIGAGAAVINLPDYRGSDVSKTFVLPIPYVVYRGEYLKADRNGLRGQLFSNDKVEINISVNGTLPVNGDDNPARRGMADLRPTVELGPTLNINLWQSPNRNTKLDFRAPVRASYTVESSPKHVGWLFSPSLNLDIKNPAGLSGWKLGMLGGPVYNDRRYNAHFYSVSPAEATAERPAYNARGGYSGTQLTMALSKRFPRYWVGGFVRYDRLAGAVFDDSPLVKKRNAISAGIAVSWVFNESSRMVNVERIED